MRRLRTFADGAGGFSGNAVSWITHRGHALGVHWGDGTHEGELKARPPSIRPEMTSAVKTALLYHFFAAIDLFPARQGGHWGAGRAATYN
jgi:hypothetical protein